MEIFQADNEKEAVVLLDSEEREMSHMRVIANSHRRRLEPGAGSPSPDANRARSSLARTPHRL
jgi:hypothetical protein